MLRGESSRSRAARASILPPVDLAATQRELSEKMGREASRDRPDELPDVSRGVPAVRKGAGGVQRSERAADSGVLLRHGGRRARSPSRSKTGKTLIIKFLTIGEPHPDGTRTVFFELNGQPREVQCWTGP